MVVTVGRIHDSEEERRNIINGCLNGTDVLPGIAVSCKDGILLTALKTNPKRSKIWKIFDRFGFIGTGSVNDYEKICESAGSTAQVLGRMQWSAGDPRIFEQVKRLIAAGKTEAFRNLFSNNYFVSEEILAQIGFEQGEDELERINFAGEIHSGETWLVIPDPHRFPQKALDDLNGGMLMKDALKSIVAGANRLDTDGKKLIFEVAVMFREKVKQKKFDAVYKNLSPKEIQELLR